MRSYNLLITTLVALIFSQSCGLDDQKKALDLREASLNNKEQELLTRERSLSMKEDSIRILLEKRDSNTLALENINLPLPDSLQGNWNANMVCTQTTCFGAFAVGDVRKETWEINSSDSTGVFVDAKQGSKLIRTYVGIYDGKNIILSTPRQSDSSGTVMTIRLRIESPSKASGSRIINQSDGCNTYFKVDLDRPRK